MEITAPCIISDMPNDAYHSEKEHLSKSGLDLFSRSPAHFYCATPKESTRAMEIGAAIHTAVLEPERFRSDYLLLSDAPDRRSSLYKEAVKAHSSETVLVSSEIANVQGMAHSATLNTDYTSRYLSQPHSVELSFFGVCPDTGVKIKCRFDMITDEGAALDLKKTQDIRHDALSRTVFNCRYHIQDAFYSRVYQAVTGKPLKSYAFFCIEEQSPHSSVVFELCSESKALAEKQTLEELQYFASKPDPVTGIYNPATLVSLPVWYLNANAEEGIY